MVIDTSSLKERAKVAVERRNYPYAVECYIQSLQIQPDDIEARRALRAVELRQAKELGTSRAVAILKNLGTYIRLLLPSKDHEQVMISCEKFLASDPTNSMILKKLAWSAFSAGYKETSAAVLEDVRQQHPEDVDGLRMLQAVYCQMDDHEKALEINSQILKITPGDREATQAIRDLSATDMSEKFVEAATSGKRGTAAQKIVKDEREAERIRREDLRTEDEVRAEIEDTKEDIKSRPEDARLYVKLGNLHLRLKQFDEADAQFNKAKELSPTEYTITMKVQDVEIARMRAGARAALATAGNNANDAKYREFYYGLLDYRLKCFKEREKQIPTDLTIAFELGNIYFEKGSLDEAIKRYQRTVHDPKNRAKSLLNLGTSFQRKKQYQLALKQFTEGTDFLEVWNEAKMNLVYQRGDCYEQMGEAEKAVADFTSIYEKDISFRDVAKRLERLQKE